MPRLTSPPSGPCRNCTKQRPLVGRGLCASCHTACRRAGTIESFPPLRGGNDEYWISEYHYLKSWGLDLHQIAERLEIRPDTLQGVLRRHQKREKASQ